MNYLNYFFLKKTSKKASKNFLNSNKLRNLRLLRKKILLNHNN